MLSPARVGVVMDNAKPALKAVLVIDTSKLHDACFYGFQVFSTKRYVQCFVDT
jgi:hypothetical protein